MARMAGGAKPVSFEPRIVNRRALHDYFITSRLECGIALAGSEVKSVRLGRAQLQDAYATVEDGQLTLHNCHIDPYEQAAALNHDPKRDRKLLAHKREIRRLAQETSQRGVTLIPLAMYFKRGLVKVEIGVARGKRQYDKRQAIRQREQERELRRMTRRRDR